MVGKQNENYNSADIMGEEQILRFENIEKSPQDFRDYRGLVLCNGLKVLLVSDVDTDISAAALSVGIGNMSDPDELPGLAHFCEHMLFMGTEKYPEENSYSNYLSQNGGGNNASTSPTITKYYFNVAPEKLDGALDRFCQFFIAPLFTLSATEREVNAVNSEHEKNLACDFWRIRQVSKSLAKGDHPHNKFGTGNKDTLERIPRQRNINVRQELLKFYEKWYSANIMCLAVIGKESLDELENMVLPKFSKIKSKQIDPPTWPKHPFEDKQFGQKVMIVPVKDDLSLTLSFVTDDISSFYKSAPEKYLAHIIGHEGKGSILSELRRRGWCNNLGAGHQNFKQGFGFFDISMDLTNTGFDHIDDILHIIFQYFYMIKQEGPKKWIFDECAMLSEMHFRFKDKEQPVSLVTLAVSSMQLYPLEEVLSAPFRKNSWRPEIISDLLENMVPSKCRILLVSQAYDRFADQVEPYYKTKYRLERVPEETIKKWETCKFDEHLAIMERNTFIPDNLNLVESLNDELGHPQIIFDSPILRVWHKQDNEFKMPKTYISFTICNPLAGLDPLNSNLNFMMAILVKDSLNEYLYDAQLASLDFDIVAKSTGVNISVQGFSDKQRIVLEKVLDKLFTFVVEEQRFDTLKEEVIRGFNNSRLQPPYKHSIYYLSLLLSESFWSNAELLDAMKLVTFQRVVNFNTEFFQRVHIECFCYGNITESMAFYVAKEMITRLEGTNSSALPILDRQMVKNREHKLNPGDSYLFEHENEFDNNTCTQLFLQCGPEKDKSNVMVSLVSQIIREPCYDYLRTKEQLGYIVHSGIRKANGTNGIRIIVQSDKHPSVIEEYIEAFLQHFLIELRNMNAHDFEQHKESLKIQKLEKPKTLLQKFYKYYAEIASAQYHFYRQESEVAILQNVAKEDLLEFFEKYIAFGGSGRKSLSVYIHSPKLNWTDVADDTNPKNIIQKHTKIDNIVIFKYSKELYPLALPFLDIPAKGARSKL